MAKTREKKEQEVGLLKDNLEKSKSVVFANYNGLKVKEVEELRKKCRAERVGYQVVKKTLLKKSLSEVKMESEAVSDFNGGIAVTFGFDDEVAPAKILNDFAKEHEALEFFGGFLEGSYVGPEKILALAKLPSKQELLAKVVGSIKAPVSGFVNVMAGNLRGLVQVLNAIKENK